jgi:hypothetical protein
MDRRQPGDSLVKKAIVRIPRDTYSPEKLVFQRLGSEIHYEFSRANDKPWEFRFPAFWKKASILLSPFNQTSDV